MLSLFQFSLRAIYKIVGSKYRVSSCTSQKISVCELFVKLSILNIVYQVVHVKSHRPTAIHIAWIWMVQVVVLSSSSRFMHSINQPTYMIKRPVCLVHGVPHKYMHKRCIQGNKINHDTFIYIYSFNLLFYNLTLQQKDHK